MGWGREKKVHLFTLQGISIYVYDEMNFFINSAGMCNSNYFMEIVSFFFNDYLIFPTSEEAAAFGFDFYCFIKKKKCER